MAVSKGPKILNFECKSACYDAFLVVAVVQLNVMNMRAMLTFNFNRRTRNLN